MSLSVLKNVWGNKKGYAFIPRLKDGVWDDGVAFLYPDDWEKIKERVRSSVSSGYDVYWCPALFTGKNRLKSNVLSPKNILWADLDEVDPETLDIKPTIAWESSHKRYQALWVLKEELPATKLEELNRAMTYYTKADKGGWALNKVLRVPGTMNHKYDPPHKGKLLWAEKKYTYTPEEIRERVKTIGEEVVHEISTPMKLLESYEIEDLTMDLLNRKDVEGEDRSKTLYYLEHSLLEAGVPVKTIFEVLWPSPWNKFKGRKEGQSYLFSEILDAEDDVRKRDRVEAVKAETPMPKPVLVTHSDLVESDIAPVEWLVEGVLHQKSYGIIGGHPKTFKSVFAHDLALSVATGAPFLGDVNKKVMKTGRVIYYQGENTESTVKDRARKIQSFKGLDGGVFTSEDDEMIACLPSRVDNLYYVNQYPLDLSTKEGRLVVQEWIKEIDPLLIIFDPFYMVSGAVDENSSKEIKGILTWMTNMRNQHGTSFLLVHHLTKTSEGGGRGLRGSSAFHGWYESGIFLANTGSAGTVKLVREFRSAEQPQPEYIHFDLSEEYRVSIDDKKEGVRSALTPASSDKGFRERVEKTAIDMEVERLLEFFADGYGKTGDEVDVFLGIAPGDKNARRKRKAGLKYLFDRDFVEEEGSTRTKKYRITVEGRDFITPMEREASDDED